MAKNEVSVKDDNTALVKHTKFSKVKSGGFSEVTTEDLAIPFIRILQALSPQVQTREPQYLEGASAGMIFNTVLKQAYDGEKGIDVIPCHYNRRFVEWQPREQGGGYINSYLPDDPIVNTTQPDDKGNDVLPNGNYLSNTSQFFVVFLHETMGAQKGLITMTSSQLKKSKQWLSQAQSLTGKDANGDAFILPFFSTVYKLTTVPEKSDKGSWFGWEINRVRTLDLEDKQDDALFDMAENFCESIQAGEVQVKADTTAQYETTGEVIPTPELDAKKDVM